MFVRMYVCMCTYYVHIYVRMDILVVYICMDAHNFTFVHTYTFLHTYVCTIVYVRTYVPLYTYVHIMYMYVCVCVFCIVEVVTWAV